ncbi:putative disease resistance protein RGA3 [Bienertia sinuspersici]
MAEGILFGIAQEVLKNLGSRALDELRETIDTIKNVLLDAEERQADSHAIRHWLERLHTAVYAADDLFDEVAILASRKQLMGGNKLTKEHFPKDQNY